MSSREPRLWTNDPRASWRRVGQLVDANAIAQTVASQLAGGVFLTGFALALGAGSLAIGVIAAIPLAAKIAQLVLSWWIERAGHWAEWAIWGAVTSRGLLLSVPVIALAHGEPRARLDLLVVVLTLSALAASVYELSVLTWLAELIPEPLRGVFWGRRGRNAGVIGIAASIAASLLVDHDDRGANALLPRFALVFGIGAVVGLLGVYFLASLPRPRREHTRDTAIPLREVLRAPLHDANFRRFVLFSALWSFAAGWMAPFYMVFMLRQLGLSFLQVTLLTSLTNMLMALSQTHWGRLGDHFGTKPVLRIGAYLIALTPLAWLATAPGRAWPVIVVQVLSGFGWSAFHVSSSNLALKLAPVQRRPSYLASFGALSGLAEGAAPVIAGAVLSALGSGAAPTMLEYRVMMITQFVLFAIATALPRWIVEPGGQAVGHLLRVMGRFRAMDASRPVAMLFDHGYTHLARVADLIAREFPRDAEPI
ncbi:MAG: Major Facilitator Superfamily transporter [Gemmatimonadetes bacterium]|nr:Major Facilitator Superfamily transporter [Gemmatimonadota bacterium]